MDTAILREKALKEWKRAWKIELIEKEDPRWLDLYSMLAWEQNLELGPGLRRDDEQQPQQQQRQPCR